MFERVQVEFNLFSASGCSQAYHPVEWVKAKHGNSGFDCIDIVRPYPQDFNPEEQTLQITIKMHIEESPKRFALSDALQKVLGIEEETRMRVVGALWQYIKSNRLQDSEDRRYINLNSEL